MAIINDIPILAIKSLKGGGGGGGGSDGITSISIDEDNNLTYVKNGATHVVGKLANMSTEVYDVDKDGIVDDSQRANAHSIESDVPADAKFTDTVYDDTELRTEVSEKMTASVNDEVLRITK